MEKLVYAFHEGKKEMKELLGGKGANLAEMCSLGLPVPNGFTISTTACKHYQTHKELSHNLLSEIQQKLQQLEKTSGKGFGDEYHPLLVSVRSGSVFSMPGMMDTILNLGLNDHTVKALANSTNNPRFAYDSYRRFIQMFADVVMDIPRYKFEHILETVKTQKGYSFDTDLTVEDLQNIVDQFKDIYRQEQGANFPTDPQEQLLLAIEAVFSSWDNPRAKIYRDLHSISHTLGTAVNIQEMVFGNTGDMSGTGVAFTRNPSTGEASLFGEFLLNAQGEDVVAGIRTPEPIARLQEKMPLVYAEFAKIADLLEKHYRDMQDIEFTIENKKLFILQTRNGKRTAQAALQIAVDLVHEQIITKEEAIQRIETQQIDQLLHPAFSKKGMEQAALIATGLPASPGAASGKIYFHAADVLQAKERGEQCLLVRAETSPEDIEGMVFSEGILTSRGGMTSHAAVVARGMGKCCIAGCSSLYINEEKKEIVYGKNILREGDFLSLDGSTGNVYLGEIPLERTTTGNYFTELMNWADEFSALQVRANADTKADIKTALGFGVAGIGLCRTEHMFFDETKIAAVRQMILSADEEERKKPLKQLLAMQKDDFIPLYQLMQGKPVTIRLLDPPLHEFLPKKEEEMQKLAHDLHISLAEIKNRVIALEEVNPMLGHRGCRLGVTFPDIYEMQTRAIIESAIAVYQQGIEVAPEIMVPFIGSKAEYSFIKNCIIKVIDDIFAESQLSIPYKIGTMMEIPRACLTADEIAEEAEFFSFGTNDLTQMTYGFSRDDTDKFLFDYKERNLLKHDPFQTLDQSGVGELIKIASYKGKSTNTQIKLGVCGEAGGDPDSIRFFHQLGLSYISCSPYRVPAAKLAAAQVALEEKQTTEKQKQAIIF